LRLRGMTDILFEDYAVRKKHLLEALVREDRLRKLLSDVELSEVDAMILLDQAIPCILHLENRCGEKWIKLLTQEAIENCGGNNKAVKAKIGEIEAYLNGKVWGSESCPAYYEINLEKDKNGGLVLGDLTLPNTRVRNVIEESDGMVDICIADSDRAEKVKVCIEKYRDVISLSRCPTDFSDEKCEELQDKIDDFIVLYIDLFGKDGFTNYYHMMASGHLVYYAKIYKNLYRYEQQGEKLCGYEVFSTKLIALSHIFSFSLSML